MAPVDARQAQDEHPVPRHHARDPAARRADRLALHRRVGDARRRGDHRLVGGGLPGPRDPAADRGDAHDAVFVTGGSGLVGGALVKRLVERGDDVVALARSDEAAAKLEAAGARTVRGDVFDEAAMTDGMRGNELVYHVAGINTFCPTDPAALFHVNVRGAEIAVRAAHAAGVRRIVLTSSAASLGEAGAPSAPRTARIAAATCRSTSAPSTRARSRPSPPRERGNRARRGLPVVRPGPRPRGRHRPDPDRLPQRQAEGVRRHPDEPRRHRRHDRGAHARRRARQAGRALPDQRRDDHVAGGAGHRQPDRGRAARRPAPPAPVARVVGAAVEAGFRARGKKPPVCREMIRTMLHGHHYDGSYAAAELGLQLHPGGGHPAAHDRVGAFGRTRARLRGVGFVVR